MARPSATNVVEIFPKDAAIARLVTALVVEAHDEWAVAERRYLSEESMGAALRRRQEVPWRCPKPSPVEPQC